jgi:hypothetical protein
MDTFRKCLHAAAIVALAVGLWQGYGAWLLARWQS